MTYLTDGEEIYNQDQKFTVIKKGKRFGLINSQKEEVLSCEYEIIRKFEDGLFQVSRKTNFIDDLINNTSSRWGIFDLNGIEIIPPIYPYQFGIIGRYSPNGFNITAENDKKKYGIFDKSGQQIQPFIYDDIQHFHPYSNKSYVQAKKDNKWGIIDMNGEIIHDFKYDYIGKFPISCSSNTLIIIVKNGFYGMMNKNYEIVIPIKYKFHRHSYHLGQFDFKDDIIIPAKLNDYWGYIDNKHNTQIPFEYDDALPFINKYAKVKKDDKWGLIDIKNNIIFGCFYREISDKFSDDLIRIGKGVLENNATVTKFGYFDSEGKEIIVCKYDFAEDFQNGRAKISLNGIEGVIDTSGIEYW